MVQPAPPTTENLAVIFQEILTVIVRLRSNRYPANDADSFRSQILAGLAASEQDAVRRGYKPEDVRIAIFAIVAFLDESILNSGNRVFADWPRKPLQEQLFGVHVAGEIFYRNVERLLAMPDSPHLEELLEIYQLCLVLGFRGRYSTGSGGDLRSITASIAEKRRRIRPLSPAISPNCIPGLDPAPPVSDRWTSRLKWTAIAAVSLAAVLFLIYLVTLQPAVSDLQAILTQHKL